MTVDSSAMFARISNMFGANDNDDHGQESPSTKFDSKNGAHGSATPVHNLNVAQCQVRYYFYLSLS